MTDATPHVVFIHGLWIHASAWEPWQRLFEAEGFTTSAPGWPGDGATVAETRADPSGLDGVGIEAICHHYADLIAALPERPIVIGHSFGGLIAQELLVHGWASAAVAIDPAPIKGVHVLPFSQLRSGLPVLGNPANRSRTVSLTEAQFRYAFGNAIPEEESASLHGRWTIPGPGRPLFEDATANLSRRSPAAVDTRSGDRGPLLLMSGTEDHTVPRSVTMAVRKLYEGSPAITDYHEFEGRGHSLTMDSGWRDVADVVLDWVRTTALGGRAPATGQPERGEGAASSA